MKRLLSICLIVCLLVMSIPVGSVAATQYGVVHGGWLRLRAAASFDAETISSYYTGTTVTILETVGSWYYVKAPDGNKGYMYSSYLTVSVSAGGSNTVGNATVWSSNGYGVRMRSGPGTGYRILKVYSVGTVVNVLERGAYWSRIQVGNLIGYMMNEFLKGGSIPVPSTSCNATIWSANGRGVRLRTGPGTGYSIIGVYGVGTRVTVLERGSVWDKIMVGSRVGYMMNEFLRYYPNTQVTNVTLNNTRPVAGNVLAVKTLTPAEAKVSYSWLVDGTERGTAATYTVMSQDEAKTIQLKVTGIDGYTGSATSEETFPVITPMTVTDVTLNLDADEAPVVGNVLKVASIEPANATVNYVWTVGGVQKSTASSYTVQREDARREIQLTVKGTGEYTGWASSEKTPPVEETGTVSSVAIYLGQSELIGAPNVGDTLAAVVKPSNATVKYRWTVGGKLVGNEKKFAVTNAYFGQTIKVEVEGIARYSGIYSAVTEEVTKVTRVVGVSLENASNPIYNEQDETKSATIRAKVEPDSLATKVSYHWMVNGISIPTATGATYTVRREDIGLTVTLTVNAKDADATGSATTATASGIVKGVINGVTLNDTSPNVGDTISASVALTEAAASTTFNWFRSGDANAIQTGFSANYQVVEADVGKSITVQAVADGNYMTQTDVKASTNVIPMATVTPDPTEVPTSDPTPTADPDVTATPTADPDATATPTADPGATDEPTSDPTDEPTSDLTDEPTSEPSDESTSDPTDEPTSEPSDEPTSEPSDEPTSEPTAEPTAVPTAEPTAVPTAEPTAVPTAEPTAVPTAEPTAVPTAEPTAVPTAVPTLEADSISIDKFHLSGINELSVDVTNPGGFTLTYAWSSDAGGLGSALNYYALQAADDAGTVITVKVTCPDGSFKTKTYILQ